MAARMAADGHCMRAMVIGSVPQGGGGATASGAGASSARSGPSSRSE